MEMTDSLARIVLLVGIAVFAPVGIYHRLRSHTDERLDRLQEGWPILLGLRLLALIFTVGLGAFLIEPGWMAWASFPLPKWARWCGAGLGFAAGVLLVWTFRSLGHNLTDTVVTRRNATLITHGPYRWVRHPFYLTLAVGVIGTTLITANAFLAIVGSATFLVIAARTSIEEQKLIERFGSEYRDYMRQTGRFLPRIWRGNS